LALQGKKPENHYNHPFLIDASIIAVGIFPVLMHMARKRIMCMDCFGGLDRRFGYLINVVGAGFKPAPTPANQFSRE